MPDNSEHVEPVRSIPTDPAGDHAVPGIALCLSGGGFRAMLFHIGSLWRLNDLGYLPELDRVSSVSGGSITAALLGLRWPRLDFDDNGVGRSFPEEIASPLRSFARTTVDRGAILGGFLIPTLVTGNVAKAYRRKLFGQSTLQDLPDEKPRFVINATNVQSGVLWRFSKPYNWDYRVGKIENPTTELAVAVAASSAFPPVLSPIVLRFEQSAFKPGTGLDLQRAPFTTKVVLSDGGVYDNLGLETAWKRYKTILVSDAGGGMANEGRPKRNWLSHSYRVLSIIDNQVRSLRKRTLMSAYISGRRDGVYWGIRAKIDNYGLPDALPCPVEHTMRLANVSTRLKRLDDHTQQRLINWGYAICDAAMRKHVDGSLPAPSAFPYPDAAVG